MADYIVKDTELTSVANAIRTAGGTNSLLSFPNGFVSAVNNISGGGSSWTVLTEESVTTSAQVGLYRAFLSYSQPIYANTIRVTFNGTEYECSQISVGDGFGYGGVGPEGPDFTEYPFALLSNRGNTPPNEIYTESAGTYSIKIEVPQSGGSSDFSTAEVTFVNNTGFSSVANVPNCVEENVLGQGSPAMVTYFVPTTDATPVVANVPLYKGSCYGFWDTNEEQFEITVSGDAVSMDDGTILITGDCTITIS